MDTYFCSSSCTSFLVLARANTRSLQPAQEVLVLIMYGSSIVNPVLHEKNILYITHFYKVKTLVKTILAE